MVTLWQDIRYGFHMLIRSPGFTIVVVLVLALGIGANTVFFSIINGILFKPLSFDDPDELVWLNQKDPLSGETLVSSGAFIQWREHNTVFEHTAAYSTHDFTLTGSGDAEIVKAACVTGDFFRILGIQPLMGRQFYPEDEDVSRGYAAILSYGLWQRRFGSDPDIIGKMLTVEGLGMTIVGVLPRDFSYPLLKGTDLWVPRNLRVNDYGSHWLQVIARLKDVITIEQADVQMDGIALQIAREFPKGNKGLTEVSTQALQKVVVGDLDKYLYAVFGAAASVLLVACANVAGLLLARLPGRQKELSVRMVLGAGSERVARQLLTESILLAALGGGLGFVWSIWGIQLARAYIPGDFPLIENIRIDGRVLGFNMAASVFTGLLFGLAPALQVGKSTLMESLKEQTTRGVGGARSYRFRAGLIICEVALATVLLAGSVLMARSLIKVVGTTPGFRPERLLTMRIQIPPYSRSGQRPAVFFQQLLEEVKAIPTVNSAAAVSYLPTQQYDRTSAVTERAAAQNKGGPQAAYRSVTPGFFRAMGIPLLKGRDFDEQDIQGRPSVVIVNERMARMFWPNEDSIGRRLKTAGPKSDHPWLTVIGVVGSTNDPVNTGWQYEMYRPESQCPATTMFLVVRAKGAPMDLASNIRTQVSNLDPDVPVSHINSMRRVLSDHVSVYRFITVLPSIFAATALLLAGVGLYGMMSYLVKQRTREIGIRMALGARMSDVLRMVMWEGLTLALIGLAVGLPVAFAVLQAATRFLYQVSPSDPVSFLVAALLVIATAVAACYIPGRRATKIDPMTALRYE
jgi:putative ABC transport system permease protein